MRRRWLMWRLPRLGFSRMSSGRWTQGFWLTRGASLRKCWRLLDERPLRLSKCYPHLGVFGVLSSIEWLQAWSKLPIIVKERPHHEIQNITHHSEQILETLLWRIPGWYHLNSGIVPDLAFFCVQLMTPTGKMRNYTATAIDQDTYVDDSDIWIRFLSCLLHQWKKRLSKHERAEMTVRLEWAKRTFLWWWVCTLSSLYQRCLVSTFSQSNTG